MKYFIVLPLVFLSYCGFSQQRSVADSSKTVCPVCKTDKNSVPIIYGKPTQETVKRAEKGEMRLGGCVIGPHAPQHYCRTDKLPY